MTIRIAYGRSGLDVDIPDANLAGILTMPLTPALPSPGEALRVLLERPIGSPPLAQIARGKYGACVVLCDITRPVPNTLIFPPLLETLAAAGIPPERTVLLIATGLHRPSTPRELEVLLGPDLPRRYRVVDHRAREFDQQKVLGVTRRGTPVHIDRLYCEADLKITTGFIEPHLMAGFSGGRKLIAPGCAGEETIKALHSPSFLEDPHCREGSLDGNPLHDELLEIARMAGHDFIVNVSLDVEHRPTGIFAGDPLQAHAEGVRFVRGAVRATLPEPADIVITTSAGHPLDLTYYQAVKGMTAALPVVRPGGMVILAAECGEGLGSPEFTRMATSFSTASAFMESIRSNPVVIDQWQLEECARATRHAEVILVSERVHREFGDGLFVGTAPTVADALARGFRRMGPSARVAVIPKGPYTLVETAAPPRIP
jgi:nickel-dependent lactate racemase